MPRSMSIHDCQFDFMDDDDDDIDDVDRSPVSMQLHQLQSSQRSPTAINADSTHAHRSHQQRLPQQQRTDNQDDLLRRQAADELNQNAKNTTSVTAGHVNGNNRTANTKSHAIVNDVINAATADASSRALSKKQEVIVNA